MSLLVPLDLVWVRALPAGEPAEGRAFHARWVKEPRTSWGPRSEAGEDPAAEDLKVVVLFCVE